MALTVEDGSGVADADTYIDLTYASAYHTKRGHTAWAAASTGEQEIALVRATDYIETRWGSRFKGYPEFAETPQALSFPRVLLRDRHGLLVEGVPENLKRAQAEYALRALEAALLPDPSVSDSGLPVARERSKVGPIEEETEYQTSGTAPVVLRPYPAADLLLQDYIRPTGRNYR